MCSPQHFQEEYSDMLRKHEEPCGLGLGREGTHVAKEEEAGPREEAQSLVSHFQPQVKSCEL
jgi:hypothetical protein